MSPPPTTITIHAPCAAVYRALLDPDAIAAWRVPEGMRSQIHEFDPRTGGRFRVSLSYDDPARAGKSAGNVDTYHGHFAELVPDQRVVEKLEFETDDPRLQGEMTVTTTLTERDGATEVAIAHAGLPPGVAPADNDLGTQMSLAKLKALVEQIKQGKRTER